MKDYPTFQWSRFSPDGRSEQVVVRGDDAAQWAEDIKVAKDVLPKALVKAFPDDEPGKPIAQAKDEGESKAPICKVHNKPMRMGKYPGSWFCATPIGEENGKKIWCKEKPFSPKWE
jgi:hypothetical protein